MLDSNDQKVTSMNILNNIEITKITKIFKKKEININISKYILQKILKLKKYKLKKVKNRLT